MIEIVPQHGGGHAVLLHDEAPLGAGCPVAWKVLTDGVSFLCKYEDGKWIRMRRLAKFATADEAIAYVRDVATREWDT